MLGSVDSFYWLLEMTFAITKFSEDRALCSEKFVAKCIIIENLFSFEVLAY